MTAEKTITPGELIEQILFYYGPEFVRSSGKLVNGLSRSPKDSLGEAINWGRSGSRGVSSALPAPFHAPERVLCDVSSRASL